ncbi:hypothetical protein BZA70DRAFT_281371 [Myxozyma melibiosi]|uniref:Riboflavin kinase n=1 Tax=Myxozyma melibiosi TaxID=54550 RepID=A0ABR1F2G8_9ASCO
MSKCAARQTITSRTSSQQQQQCIQFTGRADILSNSRGNSRVIGGFGRGSSELGIPTANIPSTALTALTQSGIPATQTGIYFGLCKVAGVYGSLERREREKEEEEGPPQSTIVPSTTEITDADATVLPMVMSLGWNPFYHNTELSAEVHVVHKFRAQFYGAKIKLAVLGYIRPESDFVSVEALVEEIMRDIEYAKEKLGEDGFREFVEDGFWSKEEE